MPPSRRTECYYGNPVLVASLAVHVGVLAGLSAAPRATVVPRLNVIDVTFTVTEPPPREVPPEPPVAPPPPSAAPAAPPVQAPRQLHRR
ncbi:MAG: hypothetical protein JRD94_11975 [Deltaproteobacteria bacterium]|nr:hypothetical protein [Deltaproteobacteria bacterium]